MTKPETSVRPAPPVDTIGHALWMAFSAIEGVLLVAELGADEEFVADVKRIRLDFSEAVGRFTHRIHGRIKATIAAKLAELEAAR